MKNCSLCPFKQVHSATLWVCTRISNYVLHIECSDQDQLNTIFCPSLNVYLPFLTVDDILVEKPLWCTIDEEEKE